MDVLLRNGIPIPTLSSFFLFSFFLFFWGGGVSGDTGIPEGKSKITAEATGIPEGKSKITAEATGML